MNNNNDFCFKIIADLHSQDREKNIIAFIKNNENFPIDFQDNSGNTLLHHCFIHKLWTLSKFLLDNGAQFDIVNKSGVKANDLCSIKELSSFWKLFIPLSNDNKIINKNNYSTSFSNSLMSYFIERKKLSFSDSDEFIYFLENNNLNSFNTILALGNTNKISLDERLSYYWTRNDLHTPYNNTLLSHYITQYLHMIKDDDIPSLRDFYSLSFEDNDLFKNSFYNTFEKFKDITYDPINELVKCMSHIIIHNNFDLTTPFGISKYSLGEALANNPLINSSYLLIKLNHNLTQQLDAKSEVKTRNKI